MSPTKLPKEIKIRVRKLGRHKARGLSHEDDALVEIDPRNAPHGSPKEMLGTYLHEGLHLCLPSESEMRIRGIEKRLRDLLWKAGYRRMAD
jgi:hypothetical protein